MKKIASFIVALMLLTNTAYGAGGVDASFDFGVALSGEGGSFFPISWDSMGGGSEEKIAQNLYTLLWNTVKNEPNELVIQRTMEKREISREEAMLLGGQVNIVQLLGKDDRARIVAGDIANFASDQVVAREIAELETEALARVKPTEIFSNETTEDSGFDLINDLNIIYKILFAEGMTDLGGNFGNPPSSQEIDVLEAALGGDGAGAGAGAGVGPGRSPSAGPGSGLGSGSAGSPSLGGADEEHVDVPFSPEICNADTTLNQAIYDDRARRARSAQLFSDDNGYGDGTGQRTAGTGVLAGAGDTDEDGDGGGEEEDEEEDPFPEPEPANYSRPPLCNDIICFRLEARMTRASSYIASDNCIACHVEKINDVFKETVSVNLTPSKVTGNLIELPKCKNALLIGLSKVNMNVIALPVPIMTPPNDDFVVKSNYLDNTKDFMNKYYGTNFKVGAAGAEGTNEAEAEEEAATRGSTTDLAAKQILSTQGAGTSQAAAIGDIEKQVSEERSSRIQALADLKADVETTGKVNRFQALSVEMDTMNARFHGMRQIFQDIEGPCDQLINGTSTCD